MNKEEADLIITEQNKSTEEILKAVAKIKSDYHELCNLKDKRIAELEEKISVLLSCKNCPENKGGFICVKEYENKCLAQKIQFIKELKQENAELRKDCIESEEDNNKLRENIQKLAVSKDLIERLIHILVLSNTPYERYEEVQKEAEQFLKENEK